jgi:hypothetical protein
MWGRRGFVKLGLGVVALAGAGAVGGWFLSEAEIASAVRRRLPFLHFDDAGLRAFAKDQISSLLAKRPTWYRWKYHVRMMLEKPTAAASWGRTSDTRTRRERMEDNLATLFLLSSDFFTSGADETRVIQYVALYDPMRACVNPFARPAVERQAPV